MPYAIAAKVAQPDKLVGIVFGDGAFGFNGFEYDTLVRLGLPVVGVLGNDGVWNNIRTFHRAMFPDRLVASELGRRPYHAVVAALGGHGELVEDPADLAPALDRAAPRASRRWSMSTSPRRCACRATTASSSLRSQFWVLGF